MQWIRSSSAQRRTKCLCRDPTWTTCSTNLTLTEIKHVHSNSCMISYRITSSTQMIRLARSRSISWFPTISRIINRSMDNLLFLLAMLGSWKITVIVKMVNVAAPSQSCSKRTSIKSNARWCATKWASTHHTVLKAKKTYQPRSGKSTRRCPHTWKRKILRTWCKVNWLIETTKSWVISLIKRFMTPTSVLEWSFRLSRWIWSPSR